MVIPCRRIDNEFTFNQFTEAVMLAIFLIGAAGAAWAVYRATRGVLHSIPRGNDDLIFF
jgi:hypothetical protein